jgi:hypothetical protein
MGQPVRKAQLEQMAPMDQTQSGLFILVATTATRALRQQRLDFSTLGLVTRRHRHRSTSTRGRITSGKR